MQNERPDPVIRALSAVTASFIGCPVSHNPAFFRGGISGLICFCLSTL